MRIQTVLPVDVGIDAERVSFIDEAEEADAAGTGALEIETAVEFVATAEGLFETSLHHVLMRAAEDGNLVVVKRRAGDVGLGIELQQCLRLGADGDLVVGIGDARGGIVDCDWLALRVEEA